MVGGNRFIALALMALSALPFRVFPKSMAQKMKEKFIHNQVWVSPSGTCQCQGSRQIASQIHRRPNIMQMTGYEEDD